jgi:mutator protein MutT
MEWNDIYDRNRRKTGRVHRRGTPWHDGEYGLVVCVWVYDGQGNVLLTRRAKEKSFPGTWENSGGAAQAGETSLQAIARELFEETGIQAQQSEFELIDSGRDRNTFFDYYCLKRNTPLEELKLLPGETDGAQWVSLERVHEMIRQKKICRVIARQFLRQEEFLKDRQVEQKRT